MAARPPAAPPTLLCKECKYENEPERVYCHNCGAKLDRSLLPPEALPTRRDPADLQRQVQKLMKPSSVRFVQVVKNFALSLLLGAVFAALVVAARPPLDLPTITEAQLDNARQIDAEVQALIDARVVRTVAYSEDDVNVYLKGSVRPKKNQDTVLGLKFEQLYVRFRDGNVVSVTERMTVMDYPLYFTTEHRVAVRGGKLAAEPVGARIGRLPLPAVVAETARRAFRASLAGGAQRSQDGRTARRRRRPQGPGPVDLFGTLTRSRAPGFRPLGRLPRLMMQR